MARSLKRVSIHNVTGWSIAGLKPKYGRTFDYLQTIPSDDGYFCIDTLEAVKVLNVDRSTLYRHLTKLDGYVYKVYDGSFVPNRLVRMILKDAGRPTVRIRSLYYISKDIIDSQRKRDMAILKYCFGWSERNIQHFYWWINRETEYDENLHGLSKAVQRWLIQYFKYVVNGHFDFNRPIYDEMFS